MRLVSKGRDGKERGRRIELIKLIDCIHGTGLREAGEEEEKDVVGQGSRRDTAQAGDD